MRRAAVFIVAATLLASGPAAAHGIWTEIGIGGATRVTVRSAGGGPLAGAAWSVLAPGEDRAFASGVTDAAGRLVFRPDRAGAWRVKVAGADGHGAVITVDITPQELAGTAPVTAAAYLHGPGIDSAPAAGQDHDPASPRDHAHDDQAAATGPGHGHAPASPERALRIAGGAAALIAVFAVMFVLLKRRAR